VLTDSSLTTGRLGFGNPDRPAERNRVSLLDRRPNNNQLVLVSGLLTMCSVHNLIKLHIGNGLVPISAGMVGIFLNSAPSAYT
jgi:hypothetical protein